MSDLDPRMGGFLTATLSHGVRTPLHSLLGFLELLSMGCVDGEQRRLVDQLVSSSEELLRSNDRLVMLLRVLSAAHPVRVQPVAVGDLVSELTAGLELPVAVHVAPGAPRVLTSDVPALLQVLTELLTNALVHGAAPVTLGFDRASSGADRVCISVTDAGSGISAADAGRLVGPDHLDLSGGTAGLLLVRRLVSLLEGHCAIAAGPTGTRVTVELPVALAAHPARSGRPGAPGTGPAPASLRVLLVEDNATNRLLAQRQLDRLGHVLTAVATGVAGVEAALTGDFDVVLMDLHLPDIDGCEATRRIRLAPSTGRRRLRIVAVTADGTAEAREACLAAGVDEILTKPVDLRDLAASLARVTAVPADQEAAVEGGLAPAVLRRVGERVDNDPETVAQFVSTFLGELPGQRLRIQAALRRCDTRTVLAGAESLRTSSDTMGASALAGACAALGAAAATQSLDTARVFLPSLLLHCQQLQDELLPYTDPHRVVAALS